MTTSKRITPQIAFWGICIIALTWLAATLLFETHLGWPVTLLQWIKRLIGWLVEMWLVKTFFFGARRCAATVAVR